MEDKNLKFKSFSEITLQEYRNIHNVLAEYNDSDSPTKDLDYRPLLLSMISNQTEDYFLSMPNNLIMHYNRELTRIKNNVPTQAPKNFYKIKNKYYRLHTDVSELVESEFRQLAKFLLDSDDKNIFENLPMILSFLLVPCKSKYNLPFPMTLKKHVVEVDYDKIDHNKESQFLLENISIQDAYNIQFFFLQKYPAILKELLDMSEKIMEKEKSTPQMRSLLKRLKKVRKAINTYTIGI